MMKKNFKSLKEIEEAYSREMGVDCNGCWGEGKIHVGDFNNTTLQDCPQCGGTGVYKSTKETFETALKEAREIGFTEGVKATIKELGIIIE